MGVFLNPSPTFFKGKRGLTGLFLWLEFLEIIIIMKQITGAGGIFYGWWLVGVGVFLLTLMSLCVFRGLGVMMVVLQKEFAWTRTQISLGTLFSRVEGAALGPLEGFLIDKIGA